MLNLALSRIPTHSMQERAMTSIRAIGSRVDDAPTACPNNVCIYAENPLDTAEELKVISKHILQPQSHATRSPNNICAYANAPPVDEIRPDNVAYDNAEHSAVNPAIQYERTIPGPAISRAVNQTST